MANPKLDKERVSMILCEAHFHHDKKAVCSKWGIAWSTLMRYQRLVLDDPQLAHMVALKKSRLEETWVKSNERLVVRCASAIEAIVGDIVSRGDGTGADIHSIAGAIQIASNAIVASKMVDATVTASLGRNVGEEIGSAEYVGNDKKKGEIIVK